MTCINWIRNKSNKKLFASIQSHFVTVNSQIGLFWQADTWGVELLIMHFFLLFGGFGQENSQSSLVNANWIVLL